MSTWMRVINTSAAGAPAPQWDTEEPPAGPGRGMTRAMSMPPVPAAEGPVTLRSKEGKERDREKRFSFFKKNK